MRNFRLTPLTMMLAPCVIILSAGLVAYANSLHVPFVLDDHYTISYLGQQDISNILLHGGPRRITDVTFSLNYKFNHVSVAGYHIVNILIHLLASFLVYFLSRTIITSLRPPSTASNAPEAMEILVPFATALLFVCHPLQTQAVTYIIQRYSSLATFLYLLSTLGYLKARLAFERSNASLACILWSIVSFVSVVLAMLSKQIAFTLPFMLLFIEAVFLRRRLFSRRFCLFTGIAVAVLIMNAVYQFRSTPLDDLIFDLKRVTSEDPTTDRIAYFLTQLRVVALYIKLLCVPVGQSLVHGVSLVQYFDGISILFITLHVLISGAALLLLAWSRKNLENGLWRIGVLQRMASFGIIWFYLTLLVESSIFPIRDIMFEHRVYLPSFGFFLSVVCLSALVLGRLQWGGRIALPLLAIVSIALCALTLERNRIWNSPLLLWQESVAVAPNKWLAVANLGDEYLGRNMPDKALPLYVRAIELNPYLFIHTKAKLGYTLKYLNIGNERFSTGEEYILPGGPAGSGQLYFAKLSEWDATIGNNLGLAYEYLGQPDKAMQAYRTAVFLWPEYDLAWYNQGLLANRIGNRYILNQSLAQLQRLNPQLHNRLMEM